MNPYYQIVDDIIAANTKSVELYKSGKKALIGLFIGQAMKYSQGTADPQLLKEAFIERLGE